MSTIPKIDCQVFTSCPTLWFPYQSGSADFTKHCCKASDGGPASLLHCWGIIGHGWILCFRSVGLVIINSEEFATLFPPVGFSTLTFSVIRVTGSRRIRVGYSTEVEATDLVRVSGTIRPISEEIFQFGPPAPV